MGWTDTAILPSLPTVQEFRGGRGMYSRMLITLTFVYIQYKCNCMSVYPGKNGSTNGSSYPFPEAHCQVAN